MKRIMATNMEIIATCSFPKATIVTDRFHVQKLTRAASHEKRITYHCEAIEQEKAEMALVKETGRSCAA